MTITLRYYQQAAVNAIYKYLREKTGNPCVVLPTAAGKSLIIAQVCKDTCIQWNGRVVVLAHVKELLEQNAAEIQALCPMLRVGIYSAGLNRRDTQDSVIVAGIQSVFERASEIGRADLIIIDEAHFINVKAEGRYRTFIAAMTEINPDVRIIGLTATPYRTGTGMICGPNNVLNEICYEVGVKELMTKGYLCRVVSKAAVSEVSMDDVKIVRGEYDEAEAEAAFNADDVVALAVAEIIEKTADRNSVLVFCSGRDHAAHVTELLRQAFQDIEDGAGDLFVKQPEVAYLDGTTPDRERDEIIRRFKIGEIKYLVNIGVLTVGFNCPRLDAIALLRATQSPGLFAQIGGRAFRLFESKKNALLLDFGQNLERHGPLDNLKPNEQGVGESAGKICPECRSVIPVASKTCKDCGYVFPVKEPAERDAKDPHQAKATDADAISGESEPEIDTVDVIRVTYGVHTKKGADENAPKTMRVTYQLSLVDFVSEWVCVEHTGFARMKAEKWWNARSESECPITAEDACDMARDGLLREPNRITVKTTSGSRFPEITKFYFPVIDPEEQEAKAREKEDQMAIDFMDMLNGDLQAPKPFEERFPLPKAIEERLEGDWDESFIPF